MNNLGKCVYIAVLAGLMQAQFGGFLVSLFMRTDVNLLLIQPMFMWALAVAVVAWAWYKQPWTRSLRADAWGYAALLCYLILWVLRALNVQFTVGMWLYQAFLVCACVCTWRLLQHKPHLPTARFPHPKPSLNMLMVLPLWLLVGAAILARSWWGLGVAVLSFLGLRWLVGRYPGAFGPYPVVNAMTLTVGLFAITSRFSYGPIRHLLPPGYTTFAAAVLAFFLAIWLLVQGRRQGWFVFEVPFPKAITWLLLLGGLFSALGFIASAIGPSSNVHNSVLLAWQLLAIGTIWHTILAIPKWLKAPSGNTPALPKTH